MRQWADEGAGLPDIQKRLKGHFEVNITYMEARLLVLDLGIEIKVEEEDGTSSTAEVEEQSEQQADERLADDTVAPLENDSPAGSVKVTTDEITRPGAMVSGQVKFSDGVRAAWMIDEHGRLGLEPETPGYQATEADLGEFEKDLRALLQG